MVRPTPKYDWSPEDLKLLEEAKSCAVLEHSLPASAVPRRCEELDWSKVHEASARLERAVEKWLRALRKEYEPTEKETLIGTVWKHKTRNLYIVPAIPTYVL